ncbi:hypothetical protein PUN28_009704 [Cardiocondyla obscurior]|uniref:Uncharacterized protein n=1 Tax=Cardiocondyla obscurior TaxID=286306 RepID=A0AAW2FWW9_9HYME
MKVELVCFVFCLMLVYTGCEILKQNETNVPENTQSTTNYSMIFSDLTYFLQNFHLRSCLVTQIVSNVNVTDLILKTFGNGFLSNILTIGETVFSDIKTAPIIKELLEFLKNFIINYIIPIVHKVINSVIKIPIINNIMPQFIYDFIDSFNSLYSLMEIIGCFP